MIADARKFMAAAVLLFAAPASAHSFGQIYTLPMPFWLYGWAAAATLIASFVVAGLLMSRDAGVATDRTPATWHELPGPLVTGLRDGALLVLLLCVATGFFGAPVAYANFNMTCFWVVFLLGFAYLTVLVGDLYALINPWRTLALLVGRFVPALVRGRIAYPRRWGYVPAIVLYGALIWLELFGKVQPFALALMLSGYTLLNLAAIALVGATDWFRYGEVFSVLLRLLARLAPVAFEHESGAAPSRRFRWRRPLAGLFEHADEPPTLLVFGLFMLSATAFDGLHQAKPWVRWFWSDLYLNVFSHGLGHNIVRAFPTLLEIYRWWQTGWLLLSPLLYLGAYLAAIFLVDRITGRRFGVATLGRRFFHSLLPIVLVYHVTHYYTLLLGQGPKILALASDPFGFGWNLFGTAGWFPGSYVPDVTTVWHVQVGLILLGHIASVVVAHREALRIFPDRRTAALSQLPMLALMIAFTVAGLWILSLPFEAPLMQPPV